jgi:hypothetical protein
VEPDDPMTTRPSSPKPERAPEPSEGELSRIAREAVRQPPDRGLERQLARMGLVDAEPAAAEPGQPGGRSTDLAPEVERLSGELRRAERILWVLGAVTAILAVIVIVLLVR